MKAEILSVGTELLLGNIVNTDARDISQGLSQLGIDVYYHTVVGDNPARLTAAVEVAKGRSDLIITTGGLGPTYDDLTKQVLAAAFGLELYFDEAEAAGIRAYFEKTGREMTDNNLQQAWLPVGCTVLHNDWGTAPGCAFVAEGVRVIMLPGPPRECNAMFQNRAVPYLAALSDEQLYSHNIRIFGMGESAVESLLREKMEAMENPTLAPYAKEGEVMLRLTAKAPSAAAAEALMAPVLSEVRAILGAYIYGIDVESMEEAVFRALKDRGLTLAAAESCTGGLIAKRLTDIPGASEVFRGGATVYTNLAKVRLLDIPAGLLEAEGAVSAAVAKALALSVREKLGADLGVAVTGLAGPEGDGKNEVGTVFVALARTGGVEVRALKLQGDRARIRLMAAQNAFDMVLRALA